MAASGTQERYRYDHENEHDDCHCLFVIIIG